MLAALQAAGLDEGGSARESLRHLHHLVGHGFIALVGAHFLAALYHLLVRRDDLLRRMWFGYVPPNSATAQSRKSKRTPAALLVPPPQRRNEDAFNFVNFAPPLLRYNLAMTPAVSAVRSAAVCRPLLRGEPRADSAPTESSPAPPRSFLKLSPPPATSFCPNSDASRRRTPANTSGRSFPRCDTRAGKVWRSDMSSPCCRTTCADSCSPFFGGGSVEIACNRRLNLPVAGYDIFGVLVNYWQTQIARRNNSPTRWQNSPPTAKPTPKSRPPSKPIGTAAKPCARRTWRRIIISTTTCPTAPDSSAGRRRFI